MFSLCIKLSNSWDVYTELTLDICVHLLYNNKMLSDGFCICVVEIGLFSLHVWKLARWCHAAAKGQIPWPQIAMDTDHTVRGSFAV